MIGRWYLVIMTLAGAGMPPGSERVSSTGHPMVGETITLHRVPHVVVRVEHRERPSEIWQGRILTSPVVYVAPCYMARLLARRRSAVRS